MNPKKLFRIQLVFKCADGLSQQVSILSVMQCYIITLSLYPIYQFCSEEEHMVLFFDHQSLYIGLFLLQIFKHSKYAVIQFIATLPFDLCLCSVESLFEPIPIKRFQQIVKSA